MLHPQENTKYIQEADKKQLIDLGCFGTGRF
jgi:hypothetical protein